MSTNAFLPAFGNKPKHIIGRAGITADFLEGLSLPIGHRNRATVLIGQRGTGKTTLLLEFADLAEQAGYVPARVTASDEMLDEIIQTIQIKGEQYVPAPLPKVKGVSVGALRFSFGLTFTEETKTQFGPRIKLGLLCDELARYDKGVLILVDEVQPNTSAIRTLATTYQHLMGEEKNIVIVMAGLPTSMSAVLNDDILTFLNRAHQVYLEPLPLGEISIAYAAEFARQEKSIVPEVLDKAVLATKGYPYLYQLIGYYILGFAQETSAITSEIVEQAIDASKREMIKSVFNAALKPLSDRDEAFLKAMSKDKDESSIADIRTRMKVTRDYAQLYRSRLIEAGIIAPVARGKLEFVIPYLGEYLRGEF
ncbi:MAG: ATP-binding protein [Coriobacteriia bacterium]|nr:ATP-binding protein [Coriobacteriia bacterium]